MKRFLSLLLALILLASSIEPLIPTAKAEGVPTIGFNNVDVHPGGQVAMTLSISGNPGIAGLVVTLNYDKSVLSLVAVKNGSLISALTKGENFVWDSSDNCTSDGTLATFTFAAAENAELGSYDVGVIVRECVNEEFESVECGTSTGTVTVKQISVPATGISLDRSSLNLTEGNEATLVATIEPSNSTDSISWSSSKPAVATVDQNGKVTAVAWGETTITVATETIGGSKTASCAVTVECGHSEKSEVPAKSPTCFAEGNNLYYNCDSCGKVLKADGVTLTTVAAETLPMLTHSFTGKVEDDKYLVPNTGYDCQHIKKYYYSCIYCGTKTSSSTQFFEGTTYGPHKLSTAWITENNHHFHKCKVSGCNYNSEPENCYGGTATCLKRSICQVCMNPYGELAAHVYKTEWSMGNAEGHWHDCTICTSHDNPVPHNPNIYEATEFEAKVCLDCGYVIQSKLPHTHVTTEVVGFDATCLADGQITYYTCPCGKWFADAAAMNQILDQSMVIIPALGHTEVTDEAVAPTCTADGTTAGKHCSACNEILISQEIIPAFGHDFVDGACTRCSELDPAVYAASGTCGENVTWKLTCTGTLIVSGIGRMYYPEGTDTAPWAAYRDQITQIIIEPGVETVCANAFRGCANVTEVVFPDSLKEIGEYAFAECSSLINVELPGNLTKIGSNAFSSCEGMQDIRFSGAAPSIATDAFANVTATVFYEASKPGWNTVENQNYGGNLTWYAISQAVEIAIEQNYLSMVPHEEAVLRVQANEALLPYVTWTAANARGIEAEPVVSVDAEGKVTALRAGTAYVTVSFTVNGNTYSDRCRIDVVESETDEPIIENVVTYGVDLLQTSAKVSMFSTDYAKLRYSLNLKQNMTVSSPTLMGITTVEGSNVVELPRQEDTGCAVEKAAFADPDTAAMFDLRVVDDRTLEIIPTQEALRTAESSAAKFRTGYVSAIVLTVEGQEILTNAMKLTVDKKLPTVKASTVKINSFYQDAVPVVFTGIKAAQIEAVSVSDGFVFDEEAGTVTYVGTSPKASGKLSLRVVPEGWTIARPVTVSLSVTRTEPTMKLSASSVTLLPGSRDKASVLVTVNQPNAPKPELILTNALGKKTEDIKFSYADGVITLEPAAGAPYEATYKLTLQIPGAAKKTVLTIKTAALKAKPSVKVKASGSIDTAIPNSPIILTATFGNYRAGSGESFAVTVTKAGGKPVVSEDVTQLFRIVQDGNVLTLTEKKAGTLEKGFTYTANVQADVTGDGSFDCENSVKLSVKWSLPAKVPVSVTLKAKGSIDVIRPASEIQLTPTVKNWFGFEPKADDLVFYTGTGRTMTEIPKDAVPFNVTVQKGVYVLTSNGANSAMKYSVSFKSDVKGDGTEIISKAAPLTVKMGSSKLTQSTKAVSLLKKDCYDNAEVRFTTLDTTLSGIAKVQLDAKSAALLELHDLGNGRYAIGYRDSRIQTLGKGVTAKLELFLEGNHTAKPNATFTVKVTAQ